MSPQALVTDQALLHWEPERQDPLGAVVTPSAVDRVFDQVDDARTLDQPPNIKFELL